MRKSFQKVTGPKDRFSLFVFEQKRDVAAVVMEAAEYRASCLRAVIVRGV